jgi:hypothetical protein
VDLILYFSILLHSEILQINIIKCFKPSSVQRLLFFSLSQIVHIHTTCFGYHRAIIRCVYLRKHVTLHSLWCPSWLHH